MATLLIVLAIFYVTLTNKRVQGFILQKVTSYLESELGTKVQVKGIDFHFFNQLELKDVYIEDLSKDTLLYAQSASVGFNIWKALGKKIEIRSLSFYRMYGNLRVDKTSVSNIDFILKYLQKFKKPKLIYKIDAIHLTESRLRYVDARASSPQKAGLFDPAKMYFQQINLDVSLHHIGKDSLNLDIHSLSCTETSGLKLKKLSLQIDAGKKLTRITKMHVIMPMSEIYITEAMAKYNGFEDWKEFDKKVKFNLSIAPSELSFSDLSAFVPAFKPMRGKLSLQGRFKGNIANLKCRDLKLAYGNSFVFNGDFDVTGLPNPDETFLYADIKDVRMDKAGIQDFVSDLSGKPFVLPVELSNLGTIHYSGNISGFLKNMVAYGTFKTNIGRLSTDILLEVLPEWKGLNYSGSLSADNLHMGMLYGKTSSIGDVSFKISTKGQSKDNKLTGEILGGVNSLVFNSYTYTNIKVNGKYNDAGFIGSLNIDDKNAKLDFNGAIDLSQKMPIWNFGARVEHVKPEHLNLIKGYPDLSLSFNVTTNFVGNAIENADGNIIIDSISIKNGVKSMMVKKIDIHSEIADTMSVLELRSDLFRGKIRGLHSLATLGKSFERLIAGYLPAIKDPKEKKNTTTRENSFAFTFSKFNINQLASVLNIPIVLDNKTNVCGYYNDTYDKFRLECNVPFLQLDKTKLSDIKILCENPDDLINLSVSTILMGQASDNLNINLASQMKENTINVDLDWKDNQNIFAGGLKLRNNISRNDSLIGADITILPTQISLNDSLWNIHGSSISTKNMKSFLVNGFVLEHQDQFIKIDGMLSDKIQDSLNVRLNDIHLENIFNLIKLYEPKITARVTGDFVVLSALKNRVLKGDLSAKDFYFNNALWGDVVMKTDWDDVHKKLNANGKAFIGKDTLIRLTGEYYPKVDSVEFYAAGDGLPLDFLRHYLNGVIQNIRGKAYGKLHLFGTLQQMLFAGNIGVKNGAFDVDFLKTSYSFNDTIRMTRNGINFKNITLYDKDNNKGIMNGFVTHSDAFKDIKYDLNIDCKNVLALNTKEQDNTYFYGKAYGTGNVHISGTTQEVLFNIAMRTEPSTKVFIPFDNVESATESNFISFVDHKSPEKEIRIPIIPRTEAEATTNIRVNLLLDANPNAEICLITDVVGGDYLKGNGNGNLRVEYDRAGDMKMYGNYEIENGEYLFTLQEVFRKTFTINKGGTLRWSGDPYSPIINLDAIYPLSSVSLLDLMDESQLEGVKRSSVPVNCLLNLTGDLQQPTIKFDLQLPTDEELQRKVKNIVNTDEMMNREMLYLLIANRFYRPDYMQAATGAGVNEMVAVVSTTVSGQLNNWISQMSNKVNFNLNLKVNDVTDPQSTQEYGFKLGYQPSDRLLINGNLGYRKDNFSSSNFIGDFDLEYKLNRSGKLRAKAYTHTNDKYYLKSSLTTQGVGITYKEDFDSPGSKAATKKKLKNDSIQIKNDSSQINKRANQVKSKSK